MDTLVEMGFGNRELNHDILKKNNGCMDKTVQYLTKHNDDGWAERR